MSSPGRPLLWLDLLNILIVSPLVSLGIYLVVLSVDSKLNDCEGFYTRCGQETIKPHVNPNSRSTYFQQDDGQQALIQIDRYLRNFAPFIKDSLVAGTSFQSSLKSGEAPDNLKALQAYLSLVDQAGEGKEDIYWNYDWFSLNQHLIVYLQLLSALFGFLVSILRHRRLIFAAILMNTLLIVQLISFQAGDDRDFPSNIYREKYAITRYILLYTENTWTQLILKSLYLIFTLTYINILVIYFALLRFIHVLYDYNSS